MSTDLDQENSEQNEPVIVDCDVLEAAKENIQPLAKGRRVTTLAGILATPHVHRESRLAATRNRLRMNVQLALENADDEEEEDEEDEVESADPLEAYCQYVYWVVENYPQGHSAESGLLELLEEATRVLKDHQGGKWRGDLRYLKLWVLYASYVEKPAVIFKFCMVNDIGTSHSLLYEEFALALERAGRKTQADETYRVGIARKAQPVERLESKYKEFQKRMMSSPTLPSSTDSEEVQNPDAPVAQAAPKRKVLAEAKAASRTSSRTTRSSSRSTTSSTPTTTPTLPQTTRPQPNARLQVYVDPSPEEASSPAANEEETASPWTELGTRKSRVKENIKEATKAAGTTLRQAGKAQRATAARRTPKIDVYRDPSPDAAQDEPSADGGATPEPEDASPPPPQTHTGPAADVVRDAAPDAPAQSSSKPKPPKTSATAVFRDDAPAPKSAKGKAKPALAVFRDDPAADAENAPAPRAAKGAPRGKGRPAVFRDDPAPAPAKIPVFRDEDAGAGGPSKPGRRIDVFRDAEPEPAPVAPAKAKGKIAVFCDDDAAEPQASAPAKGKIAVFRDDDTAESSVPAKGKGKGKGKVSVFRDDDAQEPVPAKAKGTIAVFRDDDAAESAVPAKAKGKGRIPVFRDEDVREPAPAKTKGKISAFRDEDTAEPGAPAKGKGKIPVFRDEDVREPAPAKGKGKIAVFRDDDAAETGAPAKSKGKIPVFRDEEPAPAKSKGKIPVFRDEEPAPTPAFVPYRDEEEPPSPTKPSAAGLGRTRSGGSVGLGITGLGAAGSKTNSEAEALRRDPLKNYAADEKVELD